MVIGITLMVQQCRMQAAGIEFSYNPNGNVIINDENVLKASIIVAFITLIATILFSVYLKGVFGRFTSSWTDYWMYSCFCCWTNNGIEFV